MDHSSRIPVEPIPTLGLLALASPQWNRQGNKHVAVFPEIAEVSARLCLHVAASGAHGSSQWLGGFGDRGVVWGVFIRSPLF